MNNKFEKPELTIVYFEGELDTDFDIMTTSGDWGDKPPINGDY